MGRVYNLDAALAAALLADGCAEVEDVYLGPERRTTTGTTIWQAAERRRKREPVFVVAGLHVPEH
jgi:hypothetical protein